MDYSETFHKSEKQIDLIASFSEKTVYEQKCFFKPCSMYLPGISSRVQQNQHELKSCYCVGQGLEIYRTPEVFEAATENITVLGKCVCESHTHKFVPEISGENFDC